MRPITLRGNTWPVRAELYALGGRWDERRKCWLVPPDRIEEALRLLRTVPKRSLRDSIRQDEYWEARRAGARL